MGRILVTGGNGLVGSALRKIVGDSDNVIFTGQADYNLTNHEAVKKMFKEVQPDMVIHSAARVGGIGRNLADPVEQFYDNIMMNTLVIHHAAANSVRKLIAFSSACAFPGDAEILSEDILHEGPPFPAHEFYAYSKRMVDVQIRSLRLAEGKQYCTIIPGNIFGENDNFDLENGHVVPSLIHRCYLARKTSAPFEIWGDGSARREFLYASDVAQICLDILRLEKIPDRLIIAGERAFQIREIVKIICKIMNYDNVRWLVDKPNGQPFRNSNLDRFKGSFPDFEFTDVEKALRMTINWFCAEYPRIRT